MVKKKLTVDHLLYGQDVADLLASIEAEGFKPSRAVIVAVSDDKVRVVSGLNRYELIGVLQLALESVVEGDS